MGTVTCKPIGAIGDVGPRHATFRGSRRDSLGCLKGYARAEKDHRKYEELAIFVSETGLAPVTETVGPLSFVIRLCAGLNGSSLFECQFIQHKQK
jgi:hypothetical protein